MHELGITQNLLELALKHAEQAGAKRIVRLNLIVGEFSSVGDDSVQFYWDFLSRGTIAEGAELHFERVPGELECLLCGHRFRPNGEDYICPHCAGTRVVVAGGEEFRLESIEVED